MNLIKINEEQKFFLQKYNFIILSKNSDNYIDLKNLSEKRRRSLYRNNYKETLIELIITNNYDLQFSKEDFKKMIKSLSKEDLRNIRNGNEDSILMQCFTNNEENNLNLDLEIIDYLIYNSNHDFVNKQNDNSFIFAIYCNKREKLNLNFEQLSYLYEKSYFNSQSLVEIKTWEKLRPDIYAEYLDFLNDYNKKEEKNKLLKILKEKPKKKNYNKL